MKSHKFWLKTAAVLQLITAFVHALSFLRSPQPTSEEEKQMYDWMITLKKDLGAGFNPSMMDFFYALSSCFTLLYLLGGLINFYLLRQKAEDKLMKGIVNINLLVFTACFVITAWLTFLPPIIFTGLVFMTLAGARLTINKS